METRITSASKEVIIGEGRPTVLIGERINPSGRKKLSEAIKAGELEIIGSEAKAQVEAGADIIDVNVGAFGVDEVDVLPRAVKIAMKAVDAPLCIDSSNPDALVAALKVYKGKPLVNSVSGEEHSLTKILPVIKEYGAAVVGLTQDDEGIPAGADRRVAIAHKIVERAGKMGIPPEDIVIDCLAFAVGADTESGQVTLETIRRVKAELGVNMTLGASNISFGLPDRDLINYAFMSVVIAAGATSLIVNVARVRPIVLAADLVLAQDKRARRYIDAYRQRQKLQ
ncbi:MAG: dihydropteroate synthase [Deltaproteobacteria bacterium]|nr:dihydropteroate synthase [Deltaproteobacteria bacterium]